jgi:hypothetical protein
VVQPHSNLDIPGSGGSGAVLRNFFGLTTNALVALFDAVSFDGLIGIGTIKNTDLANSLDIRETVIDTFGVTSHHTTTVAPGDTYLLDLQTNFPTSVPPYISYQVEVVDTVGGSHAAFDLWMTTIEGPGSSSVPLISFPPSTYVFVSPDVLTTTDNALIPWIPGAGRIVSELLGLLKTSPGTQPVIIEFFRGNMTTGVVGASLGTVTIPAGSFTSSTAIAPTLIGTGEFVAMTINQVGVGPAGSNLTGIVR